MDGNALSILDDSVMDTTGSSLTDVSTIGSNFPSLANNSAVESTHPSYPNTADPIAALDSSDDFSSNSDAESGFHDFPMSTASITASIFDYEQEHGRTYHAFARGKYVMPNDEREQDRMDVHYYGLRLVMDGQLFIAPMSSNPTTIIDIGTGTGIWAIDMAETYPAATVIGADLSPIQPTSIPPNLEFQIMDADDPWDFHVRFDFVHTRLMNGFSVKSWPFFYQQAFANMQPGGWVENQEFDLDFSCDDGTQHPDGPLRRWQALWNDGIRRLGLDGRCDPLRMKQQMEAAGFIHVSIRSWKWPMGAWPRDERLRAAGKCLQVGMAEGVSGLSQRVFTRALGWSFEAMEVMLVDVRNEVLNNRIHSYLPIYVVYGQKPYDAP